MNAFPELATLEAARMCRPRSDWERKFHDFDLLTIAGIPADEAERIVDDVFAARSAGTKHELEGLAA